MITQKQESVLLKKIKSLTEIEFTMLMEEIGEHVDKNRWQHVIQASFTGYNPDQVDDLEDQLDQMEDKKDKLVDAIDQAISELEDIEMIDDDQQKKLDDIINDLRWSI